MSPAPPPYPASLCGRCAQCRVVTSGKGSQFLLCRKSRDDPRYPKYPTQPVWSCPSFTPAPPDPSTPD